VTEDIVSRSDVGRNSDDPCVVVGNQLVGSPSTWDDIIVDEANAIYLKELQGSLVDCLAVTTAVGKIVYSNKPP
jgi:hypothetical protein